MKKSRMRAARVQRAIPLYLSEALEARLLLAITWSDRGTPAFDGDGFAGCFGAKAATARAVVDAALAEWNQVFPAINLQVSIQMQFGGTSTGGKGGVTTYAGLIPSTSFITLGRGGDSDGDGVGDGVGWFLDPTPLDNSEFQGGVFNGFVGSATAGGPAAPLSDLFSLVSIEMAHALGIDDTSTGGWAQDVQGYLHNTNIGDIVDTPGTLWTFQGPSGSVLMTTNNNGPGGVQKTVPIHVAQPNNKIGNLVGEVDCGNASGALNKRYLPSDLMANMLHDVYGYTEVTPFLNGTMYDTLDADGTLRITTPNGGNNQIGVSQGGAASR